MWDKATKIIVAWACGFALFFLSSAPHPTLNPSSTRSTTSGIATGRWSARVT